VLRRDIHPQSYLRTQEAAILNEGICQSGVTASIVCRYRHRPGDIAGITNLQERLHTRSIAISVANICVLAQRNSKINAVTCHLSRKFEQNRYLDPKVRPSSNDFPSSKRVNCCVYAHIFALSSSMRRASYWLPIRYLPGLRPRRHFSAREERSVDTDRVERIAQSSGMSSGTLESSGGSGGGDA
jgi:hypothetical protein